MGLFDWMFGIPGVASAPASETVKRGRRGLTVVERRQSRQRQLTDLQERIALEEARAKVRAIKARGRAKQTATTSPIASVRETLEEAFDLADSLRGGSRRDYEQAPGPASDAPGWERLLNSPAGLKLAEAVAPALAPMLAGFITSAAGPLLPPAVERPEPAVPGLPMPASIELVPTRDEDNVATNLIASVVQFAHLPPDQAGAAIVQAARAEASQGRPELLALATNSARMPVMIVKTVASRYQTDPSCGEAVRHILATPEYLETLMRTVRKLIETPQNANTGGAF